MTDNADKDKDTKAALVAELEEEFEKFLEELREDFPNVIFEKSGTVENQKEQIKDAKAFYGLPSREVFLSAKNLQWIHVPGTGIDRMIPEIRDSNVAVTNCRGPHAPSMADHVFGMIITLAHKLNEQSQDQRNHTWSTRKYSERQLELSGSTVGILGLGDIGKQVALRANGFGMKIYAVDKDPERVIQQSGGAVPPGVVELWGLDRLDEMLKISDWFIVAAPLTTDSRGLIDKKRLNLLKHGAHVIIISRGGIVDEDALTEAIQSGNIGGAGIDAFQNEPLDDKSPLWDMDNVFISPHASALTSEMFRGRQLIFKENLRRFISNEPFLYVCDKKAGF